MNEIFCHVCSKEVDLVAFGGGWVGICCGSVLHNSSEKLGHDTHVVQLMREQVKVQVDCEDICGR